MNYHYRRIPLVAAIFLLLSAVAGCMGDDGRYGENGTKRYSTNYGDQPQMLKNEKTAKAYGSKQQGGPVIHQNTKLLYSQPLSDAVNAIDGVSTAMVMLTDRNAYVALLLDNSATGTKGSGSRRETNNSGTSLGHFNAHQFTQGVRGDQLTTGYNSSESVEHEKDLSHRFKMTIALKIREMQPSVQDVYISANRDFVNQLHRYMQESWSGKSLDPYVREFNASVNRLFGAPAAPASPVPGTPEAAPAPPAMTASPAPAPQP